MPLARCRVLVVEDEYSIADEVATAIRALGVEVVHLVPTRDQALKLVEANEPIHAAVPETGD